jgi:hypothetical protein
MSQNDSMSLLFQNLKSETYMSTDRNIDVLNSVTTVAKIGCRTLQPLLELLF